jgi:hypothetical protein
MMKILTTNIWKARNDHRFKRKTWTIWQVYNAVAADIKAASLYGDPIREQAPIMAQQNGYLP